MFLSMKTSLMRTRMAAKSSELSMRSLRFSLSKQVLSVCLSCIVYDTREGLQEADECFIDITSKCRVESVNLYITINSEQVAQSSAFLLSAHFKKLLHDLLYSVLTDQLCGNVGKLHAHFVVLVDRVPCLRDEVLNLVQVVRTGQTASTPGYKSISICVCMFRWWLVASSSKISFKVVSGFFSFSSKGDKADEAACWLQKSPTSCFSLPMFDFAVWFSIDLVQFPN